MKKSHISDRSPSGWRQSWPIAAVLLCGAAFSAWLAWAIAPNDSGHTHTSLVAWATLGLGLAGTGLAVALLLTWRSAERRAERIADDLVHDLRAKDAALRSSEARWQFAVEGSGDGLWDWDVRAGTVWFSRHWKAMLGHDDDGIGDRLDEWSSRIHPDDLLMTTSCVDAYLRGETDHYECTHRIRHKDGHYLWVLDRGIAVERDEYGAPTRLIGTHKDVSDQQRMEAELRGRTSDLEQAQRMAKVGSWVLQVDTGDVQWSGPMFDMFAIPAGSSVPTYEEQARLFTPESWARLDTAVQECVLHGTTYDMELDARTATGVQRRLLARGFGVRDETGAVVQLRGIAMDVTDRHWAVNRIAHLTQLYKTLSECNTALLHSANETDLYRRVCDVVVRHSGVRMAWMGVVDRQRGRVVPVAVAGEGQDYVADVDIHLSGDDPRGRGPVGTAAREGVAVWIDDFAADERMAPWRELGSRYGWSAVAALPLRQGGQTVAVLSFYSNEQEWLDGETRRLLTALAADISDSLDRIRIAAQLEESEQRFRSLVEQSIAGAYIVRDGKFAYVNPRFKEILGYDPDDDLTGRDAVELLPVDESPASEERSALLRSGASVGSGALRVRRKDGSYASVGTHSSIAMYHQQPAIIGLMQDLSDRKVAEEQIEQYVERLEKVMFQTVGVITDLSSMRDPYTSNHERNVARLAVDIGRRMGLDERRLEGLRVGGLLHDVGKIAVPAEILVKPTRLTPIELSLVREHATIGHELLRGIDFPWPVARVAHEHHERVDGTGYPRGLKGDQICLEARIVAVADVVDSMSSHRPYRASLGTDAALLEIESHVGSRYDADVVAACAAMIRDGEYEPASDGQFTLRS